MNPTINNTADNSILISKKAYNDFAERFHDIFINMINAPSIANEALEAFNRYVRGEEISINKMDRVVQIAFLMIKPEIDKAIARSNAARLRAAARKMNKTAQLETAKQETAKQESQPDAPSAADTDSPTPVAETPVTSNHAADENTTHKKSAKHQKIRTNCRQTKKMANIIKKNRIKSNSKNKTKLNRQI